VHDFRGVFRACVVNAVREGEALMAQLIAVTREALLHQESGTHDIARRNTASDALRLLAQHEAPLTKAYPMALLEIFAEGPASSRPRPADVTGMDFGELSLVDDDQVQAQVELSRAQQLALHTTDASLSELNGLVSAAQGLPRVQPERNPLRPESYIRALQQVVAATGVPGPVRDAWMQHMRDLLGQELVGIYQRAAKDLRSHGVAPVGYGRVGGGAVRSGASGYDSAYQGGWHSGPVTGYATSHAVPSVYGHTGMGTGWAGDTCQSAFPPQAQEALLTVGLLRQMLAGGDDPYAGLRSTWSDRAAMRQGAVLRSGPGQPSLPLGPDPYPGAAAEALQDIAQLEQLVGRLVQGAPAASMVRGSVLVPQDMPAQPHSAKSVFPAMAAEVVARMVETLAQDTRLLAPVQRAVQNLEPSIQQLVRHDARFFSDDQHPARCLLDELTQRSLHFASEEAPGFSAFMRLVNEVVGHLADAQITNGEPFAAVLQALHAAWDTQTHKQQAQEQEALQAHQRKLLAEKIAAGIRKLPGVEQVPQVVMDFACGPWAEVAAAAQWSASSAAEHDPGGYLALVPELFWSAQPQLASADTARLAAIAPVLLTTLRQGLRSIAYPHSSESHFLSQLGGLHQEAVQMAKAHTSSAVPAPAAADSDMAGAASGALPAPDHAGVDADAGFVVGAWLELTTNRKVVRTQLTWTSPQKTLFLFTGEDASTQSMTRRMRDKLVADGSLRVAPAPAKPQRPR